MVRPASLRLPLPLLFMAAMACAPQAGTATDGTDAPFSITPVATVDAPWAMAFVPGTEAAIITEKAGRLLLWQDGQDMREISGTPPVAFGGQGGLGDIAFHPGFAENRLLYLSYVEQEGGLYGAVVARARLAEDMSAIGPVEIIWRQSPKMKGRGHFGHRIAFGPDGMLHISSGERQAFTPAQDMTANLGKIIRLTPDGDIPADNPNSNNTNPVTAQIWSSGHRNPLGLAFAPDGRLWETEMGPKGGDELNLIRRGGNYGYPLVSNGSHYDGTDIPDHAPGDGFVAPALYWTPSVSPGSLTFYTGTLFPQWHGDAFIGTLSGRALIRVRPGKDGAERGDHWPMERRIREVEQGPDGALYLLEDGPDARLLRLMPKE